VASFVDGNMVDESLVKLVNSLLVDINHSRVRTVGRDKKKLTTSLVSADVGVGSSR